MRTEDGERHKLVEPPRKLRLPRATRAGEPDHEHVAPRGQLRREQLDGSREDEESLLERELLREAHDLGAAAVGARAEAQLLLQKRAVPARGIVLASAAAVFLFRREREWKRLCGTARDETAGVIPSTREEGRARVDIWPAAGRADDRRARGGRAADYPRYGIPVSSGVKGTSTRTRRRCCQNWREAGVARAESAAGAHRANSSIAAAAVGLKMGAGAGSSPGRVPASDLQSDGRQERQSMERPALELVDTGKLIQQVSISTAGAASGTASAVTGQKEEGKMEPGGLCEMRSIFEEPDAVTLE